MGINWGANTYGTGTYTTGTPVAAPSITTSVSGSSFLVVAIAFASAQTFTVSDNKGNSGNYNLVGSVANNTTDGISMGAYLCTNGAGGSGHVVSLACTTSSTGVRFYVVEITGGATASLVDVSNGANTGFLGNPTSCPVTTTNQNDLILGVFQNNTTVITSFTPGSGFSTILQTLGDGNILVGQVVSATGTYDPDIGFSPSGGRTQIVTVAVKALAGSPPLPSQFFVT